VSASNLSIEVSAPIAMIGGELLRSLVSMPEAIEASRRSFLAACRGEIAVPLRTAMCHDQVLVMPAEHVSGSGVIKVISNSSLPGADRPSIEGVVLWLDGESGRVSALVDAASLTSLRTGAASGLATSLLARSDSSVLAMLGSGAQAADQIAAVCAVRPIREVRIHSRHAEHAEQLFRRLQTSAVGIRYRTVSSTREALDGADVVCAATRSTEPLFAAADLGGSVHINAVGAYRPDMREVPVEVFRRASIVVVDQVEAALAEAGDLLAAVAEGALSRDQLVELGMITAREATCREGVTVFKSVGIAAQDWSITELVVKRAREAGLIASSPKNVSEDAGELKRAVPTPRV
jgi:ornithine cyclodeaminase